MNYLMLAADKGYDAVVKLMVEHNLCVEQMKVVSNRVTLPSNYEPHNRCV